MRTLTIASLATFAYATELKSLSSSSIAIEGQLATESGSFPYYAKVRNSYHFINGQVIYMT